MNYLLGFKVKMYIKIGIVFLNVFIFVGNYVLFRHYRNKEEVIGIEGL